MQGLHLTADLRGCEAGNAVMSDVDALRKCCLAAAAASGLTVVAELFHCFDSGARCVGGAQGTGITGVVLLAESHLAVHTWPEIAAVTLDVFVCNRDSDNSTHARALLEAMMVAFAPAHIERHTLQRGGTRRAA